MEDIPRYNFRWRQGDDKAINFRLEESGQGKDLTGYKIRMDIWRMPGVTPETGPIYTVESAGVTEGVADPLPAEVILNSEGYVEILLPRSLTLSGGVFFTQIAGENFNFVYDLFLRDQNGLQEAILKGKITLERSLTLWS